MLAALGAALALLLAGGAWIAIRTIADHDTPAAVPGPPAGSPTTTSAPSPDTTATESASASASPGPRASSKPTGPFMTSLKISNVSCVTNTPGGPWEGLVDVTWQAERADNVQLYGPDATNPLGGFDGASGEATFGFPCQPNGSFLLRAVPQLQSTAGSRKDVKGRWPDSARITDLTAVKRTCSGTTPNLDLHWSSRGADEVRLFLNGTQQFTGYPTGPNTGAVVYANCAAGQQYFIRAVAYKDGQPGASRDINITW
jgi:hypothetical protein